MSLVTGQQAFRIYRNDVVAGKVISISEDGATVVFLDDDEFTPDNVPQDRVFGTWREANHRLRQELTESARVNLGLA